MKIKDSTAKKIAIELVSEQIYCSLCNISENLRSGYTLHDMNYTEKQQDAIMEQVEKAVYRSLVKIDPTYKGCKLHW